MLIRAEVIKLALPSNCISLFSTGLHAITLLLLFTSPCFEPTKRIHQFEVKRARRGLLSSSVRIKVITHCIWSILQSFQIEFIVAHITVYYFTHYCISPVNFYLQTILKLLPSSILDAPNGTALVPSISG